MAAFSELDWHRFDVWAIVTCAGVAVVESAHLISCRSWLRDNKYQIHSLDFTNGFDAAIKDLGCLLKWQEQFGYSLESGRLNFNALRDGFEFPSNFETGIVLEITGAEAAYRTNPSWLLGLLEIASEYSRMQLALGKRFFATLSLPKNCDMIGAVYDSLSVTPPYWNPGTKNPFEHPSSNRAQ